MNRQPTIAITATEPACHERAAELAARLALPLAEADDRHRFELLLYVTPERIELGETAPKAPKPVYVDFIGGSVGHRHRFGGGRGQPIARAIGLKGGANPSVLDATAGLGRDAFLLASLGCSVRLVERSPLVAELLRDGMARAATDPETAPIIERMALIDGDSRKFIERLDDNSRPEVIYLDPMFPERNKSALVKKEMRLFHALVGPDLDSEALLAAALNKATKRVVVKRPKGAPPLSGRTPDAKIESKTMRYDLYIIHSSNSSPK